MPWRGEGARLSRCHGDLHVVKGLACLGVMATYTWRRGSVKGLACLGVMATYTWWRGSLVSESWRPTRGEGARLSRCHGDLHLVKGLACLGVMATYTWWRGSLVSVSWRPIRGEGHRLSRCHGDLYVVKGLACLGVMATYTWWRGSLVSVSWRPIREAAFSFCYCRTSWTEWTGTKGEVTMTTTTNAEDRVVSFKFYTSLYSVIYGIQYCTVLYSPLRYRV